MTIITTVDQASVHVLADAASSCVHSVRGVCADAGLQHPLTQWHDNF